MPWWGWLIAAIAGGVLLVWTIAFVLIASNFKRFWT